MLAHKVTHSCADPHFRLFQTSSLNLCVWPDLPPACTRLLYATEKRTRLILEVLYNRPCLLLALREAKSPARRLARTHGIAQPHALLLTVVPTSRPPGHMDTLANNAHTYAWLGQL